jgi:hypothetical protein
MKSHAAVWTARILALVMVVATFSAQASVTAEATGSGPG